MMSHAFYVYSSWGISAVALVITIGWIWFESGRLQRELKRLEAHGIRRRSAGTVPGERG
jgi:heme exporter protein D